MKARSSRLFAALFLFVLSATAVGGCKKGDFSQALDMAVAGAEAYIAVSGDNMEYKRQLMVKFVLKANAKFMDAVATLQEAVGNKDKADALRMKANDIMANPQNYQSEEALKEVFAASNSAAQEVSGIDAKSIDATEEAKEKMDRSYINLGMASAWDGGAITMATFLSIQAGKGIDQNDENLANYEAIASVAGMVATNLPTQIDLIGTIKDRISEYYAAHELPPPSDDEIDRKAKEEEPKAAEDDEFSFIFPRNPKA